VGILHQVSSTAWSTCGTCAPHCPAARREGGSDAVPEVHHCPSKRRAAPPGMVVPPLPSHRLPSLPCAATAVATVPQMYRDDGLSVDHMLALLRAFPGQTLDFFGALRCGCCGSGPGSTCCTCWGGPASFHRAEPEGPRLHAVALPASSPRPRPTLVASSPSSFLCFRCAVAPCACCAICCRSPALLQRLHLRRPDSGVDQAGCGPWRDQGCVAPQHLSNLGGGERGGGGGHARWAGAQLSGLSPPSGLAWLRTVRIGGREGRGAGVARVHMLTHARRGDSAQAPPNVPA
jgi:hypothetical protein